MAQAITKIVTHSGEAHKDEFLALCLAISQTGCKDIERRAVTGADMSDPSVMVIDRGGVYDPDTNKFDHHQDAGLPCAYHLIARHFGLHEVLKAADPTYETINTEDLRGPETVAGSVGIPIDQYEKIADPVGKLALRRFSRYEGRLPAEMVAFMGMCGEDMVKDARQYQPDYERLNTLEIKDIGGIKYITDPQHESVARARFARDRQLDVIAFPNETAGWQLRRLNPCVDFNKAGESAHLKPQLHFVHKTGFLAVTKSREASVEDMIEASIIKREELKKPPITKRDPLEKTIASDSVSNVL